MKRILSSILIIFYLTILFRPVLPFIEYVLNKDYIASTLCVNKDLPELKCDGKCYLAKQIAALEAEKAQSQSEPVEALEFVWLPAFLSEPSSWNALLIQIQSVHFEANIHLQDMYLGVITPPPQA